MISKFALLGTLLLTSLALAERDERPEASLDHRDRWTNGSTLPNSYMAGAVLKGKAFNLVTATTVLPGSYNEDGTVMILIGIDIEGCLSGSLQLAVEGNATDGEVSWNAWGAWVPESYFDLDFKMKSGQTITLTALAASETTGLVVLENQETGHIALQEFNADGALCRQTAGWTVRAAEDSQAEIVNIMDFENITLTSAMATADNTPGVTYLPSGPSWYFLYIITGRVIVHPSEAKLVLLYTTELD